MTIIAMKTIAIKTAAMTIIAMKTVAGKLCPLKLWQMEITATKEYDNAQQMNFKGNQKG